MTFQEENLLHFIYVIRNKSDILSDEDWISLKELLSTVFYDIEDLFNKVTNWYKSRPAIINAILESERGPKGLPPNPTVQDFKNMIENEVRQHQPDPEPSPQPEPEK